MAPFPSGRSAWPYVEGSSTTTGGRPRRPRGGAADSRALRTWRWVDEQGNQTLSGTRSRRVSPIATATTSTIDQWISSSSTTYPTRPAQLGYGGWRAELLCFECDLQKMDGEGRPTAPDFVFVDLAQDAPNSERHDGRRSGCSSAAARPPSTGAVRTRGRPHGDLDWEQGADGHRAHVGPRRFVRRIPRGQPARRRRSARTTLMVDGSRPRGPATDEFELLTGLRRRDHD